MAAAAHKLSTSSSALFLKVTNFPSSIQEMPPPQGSFFYHPLLNSKAAPDTICLNSACTQVYYYSTVLIFGLFGFFFSAGTMFFSHNNSAGTVFFSQVSDQRTGSIFYCVAFCNAHLLDFGDFVFGFWRRMFLVNQTNKEHCPSKMEALLTSSWAHR